MKWLTFQDYALNRSSLGFYSPQYALEKGQFWRLLTPAFLHFGVLHTVFNSLWIWELGRRIEIGLGVWRLAGLVVLIGIGANIGQYLMVPNQLFGGMSGVIYGLLGYCWIYNRLSPHPMLALPTSMVGFMVFWLLICMTDFMSAFGVGVANAAHVSGLLLGLLLGLGNALIQRSSARD
jgi:GlpG protein